MLAELAAIRSALTSCPDQWKRLICLSAASSSSPSSSSPPAGDLVARGCEKRRRAQRACATRLGCRRRQPRLEVVRLFCEFSCLMLLQMLLMRHVRPHNSIGLAAGGAITLLAKAEAIETGHATGEPAQKHPRILVDAKYWTRNMVLGDRDNWRAGRKPCTLLERIAIQERDSVVSMGDSMDQLGDARLEANVRQLSLAQDGVLLLDEDTRNLDPMHVRYLNESGDCFDSSLTPDQEHGGDATHPVFSFEPDPNSMSWFNPENWRSQLNQDEHVELMVPDSHRIPCSEDVVVFGSERHASLLELRDKDPGHIVPFKVNFRPAEGVDSLRVANLSLASLRVSKLKIGERSYSQTELNRLVELYGDKLFDFRDELSLFSGGLQDDVGAAQNLLLIDESSIQPDAKNSMELCHDVAGCFCGNEQADVMRVICSFQHPVARSSLPCRDPISVTGYCNKICATSVIIIMDPSKFAESLIASHLAKIDESTTEEELSRDIFVGPRRVDHNRYEIVLRIQAEDDERHQRTLGHEVKLAERIKETLEKAATKSFYGIRSISIKSSIDWRRNNRAWVQQLTFVVLGSLFVLMFAYNDELFPIKPFTCASDLISKYLSGCLNARSSKDTLGILEEAHLPSEPSMAEQDGRSDQLPLAEPQSTHLALVQIDTRSITDSTHNLIESDN